MLVTSLCGHSKDSLSSNESISLQVKIGHTQARCKKITNLVFHLKLHQTRNQYLRGRLDTCTDVNIMAASV